MALEQALLCPRPQFSQLSDGMRPVVCEPGADPHHSPLVPLTLSLPRLQTHAWLNLQMFPVLAIQPHPDLFLDIIETSLPCYYAFSEFLTHRNCEHTTVIGVILYIALANNSNGGLKVG